MWKVILIILLLFNLLFAIDTFNFIEDNYEYSCFFAYKDKIALGNDKVINIYKNKSLHFDLKKSFSLNSQKPIKLYLKDSLLFVLLDWNNINIWNINSGYLIKNLKFYEKLSDILYLDSTLIASSMAGSLYSFKYKNNTFFKDKQILAHDNSVSKLLISKANDGFLSCSYDGKIIFWSKKNNKFQKIFELTSNKSKAIFSCALSSNSKYLAFSCQDKIVEIYKKVSDRYKVVSKFACPDNVYSLSFSEDEKFLILAMSNNNILVLEEIKNFFYKKTNIEKVFSKKGYIDICFWNNFILSTSSTGKIDFLNIFPIKEQIEFNVNKETNYLKNQVAKDKLNKIAQKYINIFKEEKIKNIDWNLLQIDSLYNVIDKGYCLKTPLSEKVFFRVEESLKDSFYHNFSNKKIKNIALVYSLNNWKIKKLDVEINKQLYNYQNLDLEDDNDNFIFANSFLPKQVFYDIKENIYQTNIIKYKAKALLIANENYENFPSNKNSLNNLNIFSEYLIKSFGYNPQNVVIAKNSENLKKIFENFISSLGNTPEVLIYYSGYSALDFTDKKPYLISVNSKIDNFAENGISFYKLIRDLSNEKILNVYLILETSLFGADIYQNIKLNNYTFDIDLPSNTSMFFACKFFQERIKDDKLNLDLFTYSFLKAISNAVYNKENKIKKIFDYIVIDMKNYAVNNMELFQEPVLWTKKENMILVQ